MTDETTNQVVDEGATAEDTNTTQGVEAEAEQQFDEDGNPIESEPAEEEDEIDLDDETKLKLPKSQAEKLRQAMLRQADYTRKTQELAETRKAFEVERDTHNQMSEQEKAATTQLTLIDHQLQQYASVNWQAWEQNDPFGAQAAFRQYTLLKDARGQITGNLQSMAQQRTLQQQQETAKRLEQGAAELARDIKDWSPTKAAALVEHGKTRYGFSKDELDSVDDPRLIKVLHDAYQWNEHQKKQKATKQVQAAQAVRPAAKVGSPGVPQNKLADNLSTEEWMRRRTEQLRKKGRV